MKLLTALMAFLAVIALMTGSASAEPDYSDNSTNSTLAGTDILHSLQWTDASGLSGYIFQFCNGSWDGTDCGSGTDIELKESYTTNDDTQGAIYNTAWWGQTFNASASYDIKKVGVKVFKVGNPGDVSISIYPTNATGHPDTTGAPLVTGTFNGNVITTSSPGEWANTTFGSAYALTYGTTYAIVMNLTGSVSNYMDWRLDTTGAAYSGGTKASSNNAGTVWNLGVGDDMMFETYSESGTDWVNDTWTSMTGTTNWSNVTKSVNTTTGANIAWKVYANDTSDNWNTSATYSYLTTSAPAPAASVVTIEPGVIFDPSNSNTNYTFYSQYNVTSISVNTTHIEINSAMLKAEPNTGTVNCTIYDYGTTGTHYRAYNITNTSFANNVSITQGGYTLADSVLIFRNMVKDGVAQLANATGFFDITQTLSTYNITSYLGTTEPIITAYKLFTYGVHHNMTQLRDIYANITFYDTTPADTFYINTTWYKTNTTGTYSLDCCDTLNQTALNNTETTITIPCYSNQTTVADNITAQMTVVDSAGNTNTTNATGTIVSHWWDQYWEWEENW